MKATVAVLATLLAGCAAPSGPPPIPVAAPVLSDRPNHPSRYLARPVSSLVESATAKPSPSRGGPPPRRSQPAGFKAWRQSSTARRVLACESHGNYTDMSHHAGVIYYGAWQANAAFWRTYGGDPRYLADRSRFTAPAWMQDAVAYRGWLARGWSPWSCA